MQDVTATEKSFLTPSPLPPSHYRGEADSHFLSPLYS